MHLGLFALLQRANGLEKQANAIGHLEKVSGSRALKEHGVISNWSLIIQQLHFHLVLAVLWVNLTESTVKPGLSSMSTVPFFQ